MCIRDRGYPTKDEMFASIGFGKTNTDQIIQKLIKKHKDELPKKIEDLDINKVKPKKSFSNEVRVSDLDDQVDVKFAKCCNPVDVYKRQ